MTTRDFEPQEDGTQSDEQPVSQVQAGTEPPLYVTGPDSVSRPGIEPPDYVPPPEPTGQSGGVAKEPEKK